MGKIIAPEKLTEEEIKSFKSELKALLEKYFVSIGFSVASGSDTYGLYEEKIVVSQNLREDNILEVDGWWMSSRDIII